MISSLSLFSSPTSPVVWNQGYYLQIIMLVSCLAWTYIHKNLSQECIKVFIPEATWETLAKKRQEDIGLDKMCRVNATAFLHSLITVPLAFLCAVFIKSLWDDPYQATSPIFDFTTFIMSGYFLWDTIICAKDAKLYGMAFLLHALLSLLGLYVQMSSTSHRVCWFTAVFMGTEVSTPLLHIRWFLSKAGDVKGYYFRVVNNLFLITFTVYRLALVEFLVILPFTYDCLVTQIHTKMMPRFPMISLLVVMYLWAGLNYYWGMLLLHSQLKRVPFLKKYFSKGVKATQ